MPDDWRGPLMSAFIKALIIESGGRLSVDASTMQVAADDEDSHVMFDKQGTDVIAILLREPTSSKNN